MCCASPKNRYLIHVFHYFIYKIVILWWYHVYTIIVILLLLLYSTLSPNYFCMMGHFRTPQQTQTIIIYHQPQQTSFPSTMLRWLYSDRTGTTVDAEPYTSPDCNNNKKCVAGLAESPPNLLPNLRLNAKRPLRAAPRHIFWHEPKLQSIYHVSGAHHRKRYTPTVHCFAWWR